jgi:putative ABC transport system ATP-binding protein
MLTTKDLTREFVTGDSTVTAVDGVTLTLDDGVFAAIVGPSGSGKSTLLSLLGTLDMPTSGTIEIGGADVTTLTGRELTAHRCSKVGFVFQSYNLIPNLTALQNVMLPMEFAGVESDSRHERAVQLLEQVGIDEEKQKRRPGRLSGGEQQRVAIARALANRPCLILADEPTGNLDRETGAKIVELLHELARSERTTVVAVTHDLDVAAQADVTFRLSDGRLVDLQSFEGAVSAANAAYEEWLADRDRARLRTFASALGAMIAAAPSGRRLAPGKIRARYSEAEGEQAFEAVLRPLEADDLFED